MTIKISPYYYKHLLKYLAIANQKKVKILALANYIGLSIKLDDFNQLAKRCSEAEKDQLFVLRTAAKSLPPGHGY